MSYEIVKRLRIENGEVFITSDSNKHMKAHDMFEIETIQIFDKKTGAYLGLIRHWTTEAPEMKPESIPDEEQEKERLSNYTVKHNVYQDFEGCTYNELILK